VLYGFYTVDLLFLAIDERINPGLFALASQIFTGFCFKLGMPPGSLKNLIPPGVCFHHLKDE
jgi:hypothetical protein